MSLRTKDVIIDELMGMKKRMDRLYAERFSKSTDESSSQGKPAEWRPLLDVIQTDEAWIVLADLPGVAEDDLEVKVDQSELIIQGIRSRTAASSEAAGIISSERPIGRFFRELPLPEALNDAEVSAELNRGVLTVMLQKSQGLSRKIKVQPE